MIKQDYQITFGHFTFTDLSYPALTLHCNQPPSHLTLHTKPYMDLPIYQNPDLLA